MYAQLSKENDHLKDMKVGVLEIFLVGVGLLYASHFLYVRTSEIVIETVKSITWRT